MLYGAAGCNQAQVTFAIGPNIFWEITRIFLILCGYNCENTYNQEQPKYRFLFGHKAIKCKYFMFFLNKMNLIVKSYYYKTI